MSGFESPVEIAVNTNRLFMEGLHGVLDLQFRNRSGTDRFDVDASLSGRALVSGVRRKLTLGAGGTVKRAIDLHLPRSDADGLGSAGDARFEVELIVDAGEEGRHRFSGEFTLAVLAYSEDHNHINVSINKLIEQTGDKAGMGAINEIDLSNLIKVPNNLTVNERITQKRPPRFVPIELEYGGRLEEIADPVVHRDVDSLDRCSIVDKGTGSRLLVITGQSIVLGKSREKADIVIWKMPRNDEHDHATRKISGEQCRLNCTPNGVSVEQLSKVNPTKIDGHAVSTTSQISLVAATELLLPADLGLRLRPLPLPPTSAEVLGNWQRASTPIFRQRCDWSRQTGLGGLLIERTDDLATVERYLWLVSAVAMPMPCDGRPRQDHDVCVLAMPSLHVAALQNRDTLQVANIEVLPGTAVPVGKGDDLVSGPMRLLIGDWLQDLGLS